MPYNQALQTDPETVRANGVHASSEPNGLRNEALGRPADGPVFQRLECDPYKIEVAGSNPAGTTNRFKYLPLTRGLFTIVDESDYVWVSAYRWCPTANPLYAGTTIREDGKKKTLYLHRLILNAPAGIKVDHINRNPLDNRRANLRFATHSQNIQNSRRPSYVSRCGFIGVETRTPGRFRGVVMLNKHSYYTKTFRCPVLAAAARDVLAQQLHREFATLNFRFIPASAIRPGA